MFVSKIRAEGAGADDRSPFGDFWFSPIGASSQAGIRVTGDAALRLSTVYRCVRVLAGTMARLPRCLTKPGEDPRGRDQVKGHWLSRLLRKPNRWQNGFEWHEMMVGHIALRGTGYNRIVANTSGEIEQLQPLHPDRMQASPAALGRRALTYTHDDGTEEQLPDSMVFKISGFSANGVTGLSVISYARESIGEGLAQQDYSSRFFANDAQPSGGWIEYPGNFRDKAARDAFRMSWQEAQGRHNRGKTAVLENGMKYHEIGATNKDSQFLEAKNAKVADICRWFGVPLHLAFALDRATDNNVEQFGIEFRVTRWRNGPSASSARSRTSCSARPTRPARARVRHGRPRARRHGGARRLPAGDGIGRDPDAKRGADPGG
jgi:HK97 family phage portal protein